MRNWVRAGFLLVALLVTSARSDAILCYFAFREPAGSPDGHVEGVFERINCGFDGSYCSMTFRKAGRVNAWLTLIRRPLVIDGRPGIVCPSMPWDHMHAQCLDWPSDVVPGKTHIRIAYWWVDQHDTCPRGMKPRRFPRIAVTDRFSTIR
jgi:hypothetical protein